MTRSPTSFLAAVKLFFKNYANFTGRSSRSACWWAILGTYLITSTSPILDILILGLDDYLYADSYISPAGIIFSLVFLVPSFSLNARRLHDVGKSGWWILISLTIVGLIPLSIWMLRQGDDGANKFGEDIEAGL